MEYNKIRLNKESRLKLLSFLRFIPDHKMVKLQYKFKLGKEPNLKNPQSYSEKIQWYKLYYHIPLMTKCADKIKVREYVKNKIGEKYLIPLIGIYESVEEIPWNELPIQFVLKCNHASGTNIICANKERLDIQASKKKLKKWMNTNYFWFAREWAYKEILPRIVCEKYMVDESGVELKDYKIFCFYGEPKLIQVDFNRFQNHTRNIYDINWNYVEASMKYPNNPNINIHKPNNLEEILKLSTILSKIFPHARVDFYDISGEIFFGEITFYHEAGYALFCPQALENQMGEWFVLPKGTTQR